MLTEKGVENILKNYFLQWSWNLLSNFSKHGCIFSAVHRMCLANVSTCIKLFAVTWASTALLPPRALVSAQTTLIGHWCLVDTEQWVRAWGWARPLTRAEPLPWRAWNVRSASTHTSGLHQWSSSFHHLFHGERENTMQKGNCLVILGFQGICLPSFTSWYPSGTVGKLTPFAVWLLAIRILIHC